MFLFQSSADYDTGFSVSAQCFRKDDPVTPYTSCTWMLVISIQLFIFNFNSYKKFSSPRGIKYKSSQIEHEEGRIRFVKSQSNAVKHTLFRLYPFHTFLETLVADTLHYGNHIELSRYWNVELHLDVTVRQGIIIRHI